MINSLYLIVTWQVSRVSCVWRLNESRPIQKEDPRDSHHALKLGGGFVRRIVEDTYMRGTGECARRLQASPCRETILAVLDASYACME